MFIDSRGEMLAAPLGAVCEGGSLNMALLWSALCCL